MSTKSPFWEAVKETPKLYFAPFQAIIESAKQVQESMASSGTTVQVRRYRHRTTDKETVPRKSESSSVK
jgi:hypothetical protein